MFSISLESISTYALDLEILGKKFEILSLEFGVPEFIVGVD